MSYTKNVLFRDKTNRFLPFQRTLGLDERGRLFQSVGDNTGNLTSINRKADSLQGLSIRNKKGCFAFGKTGRTQKHRQYGCMGGAKSYCCHVRQSVHSTACRAVACNVDTN